MSLINSYMDVLNESSGNKGVVQGALPGTGKPVTGTPPKVNKFENPEGMESKAPTEGHSSDDKDTKPKPAPKSTLLQNSFNPFDALVNKVLSEGEDWESDDAESDPDSDFSFSADMSQEGEGEEGEGEEGEDEMEEEGEKNDMAAVLNHLKSAVEALEACLLLQNSRCLIQPLKLQQQI